MFMCVCLLGQRSLEGGGGGAGGGGSVYLQWVQGEKCLSHLGPWVGTAEAPLCLIRTCVCVCVCYGGCNSVTVQSDIHTPSFSPVLLLTFTHAHTHEKRGKGVNM